MPRLVAFGAAALASALLVGVAAAPAPGKTERDRTASQLVRLTDLGPGYGVGDDGGCGIGPTYEGSSRRLRRFNDRHRGYHGCDIDFLELWRPPSAGPRPRVINSIAIRFADTATARAAFRIGSDFVDYNVGVPPRSLTRISASRTVGDDFRMYRTSEALVDGAPRSPALVVIWRAGRTVSIVLVSGKAEAATQEEALRLAETQQRRIVKPEPLPAHANDDRFVSLNDPTVDVPVHWLGLRFRAARLPGLAFDEGGVTRDEDAGPGFTARVSYRGSGVTVDTWRPAAWAKFTKSRTGRLVWAARCTKAERIPLPAGYAILYSGHTRHQKRCGRRPDLFLAHVYVPGAVVAVNMPICAACIDRGKGPDPWNSARGMRAIVNGLTVRPKE